MNNIYLAGYIDGDGHIGNRIYIQKPKQIKVYEISIQICSTSLDQINFFQNEFSGAFNKRPEKRTNRATSWVWYIKGKRARDIMKEIEPFLILKKIQCRLAISIVNRIEKSKSGKGNSICENEHNERKKIMDEIKKNINESNFITKDDFEEFKNITQSIVPTDEDFCYLSGLIDAEGCFRISHWYPSRPGRSMHSTIKLEIGNTRSPIFPWLMERFGGYLTFRKPSSTRQHPMIIWSISSDKLYKILPNLIKHTRLKKERAQILFEFHELGFKYPQHKKGEDFIRIRDEIISERKVLIETLHNLNKKGVKKSTSLGLP
jgi:hypothetical protein